MSEVEFRNATELLISAADLAAKVAEADSIGLSSDRSAVSSARAGGQDQRHIVVDCRFTLGNPDAGEEAYRDGHIPGAFYAHLERDLSEPVHPTTGRHPLPSPARLWALFSRFGIGRDTRVVAYDDGSGAFAARLWWLLRFMGHRHATLLDGGLAAWLAAGQPLSRLIPEAQSVSFHGDPGQMPVRDAKQLEAGLPAGKMVLLDVRAADRYRGVTEPIDAVAGHVPGALNIPFAGNLRGDGRFKDRASLADRYAPLLKDRSTTDVVLMCGSGVTACHGLFALELAGMGGASLYPGSWSEWIRAPDRPVVTGE